MFYLIKCLDDDLLLDNYELDLAPDAFNEIDFIENKNSNRSDGDD